MATTLTFSRISQGRALLLNRAISVGSSLNGKGKKKLNEKHEETPTNTVDVYECLNHEVCLGANILKNGEDPPLKSDSEYPDWLWRLADHTKPPNTMADTESKTYWRQQNKKSSRLRNKEMQLQGN